MKLFKYILTSLEPFYRVDCRVVLGIIVPKIRWKASARFKWIFLVTTLELIKKLKPVIFVILT